MVQRRLANPFCYFEFYRTDNTSFSKVECRSSSFESFKNDGGLVESVKRLDHGCDDPGAKHKASAFHCLCKDACLAGL